MNRTPVKPIIEATVGNLFNANSQSLESKKVLNNNITSPRTRIIKKDKKVLVHLRIDPIVNLKIKDIAKSQKVTFQEALRFLLNKGLENY